MQQTENSITKFSVTDSDHHSQLPTSKSTEARKVPNNAMTEGKENKSNICQTAFVLELI